MWVVMMDCAEADKKVPYRVEMMDSMKDSNEVIK